MADVQVDPKKLQMAQGCAKLFVMQMQASGVPVDVQLMTVELLTKTIFLSDVVESKRLQLFDRWARAIRETIKSTERKQDAKAK